MSKLLLGIGIVATTLLILGFAVGQPSGPNLVVDAYEDNGACSVVVNGERVDSQRLLELATAWPSRRGIVRMEKGTPYRCVGGVVFTLQRAGFVRVRAIVRKRSA